VPARRFALRRALFPNGLGGWSTSSRFDGRFFMVLPGFGALAADANASGAIAGSGATGTASAPTGGHTFKSCDIREELLPSSFNRRRTSSLVQPLWYKANTRS